jgi:hypothetical protein
MEPEGSLPRSQESSTGPYPKPDRFNPYHPILTKIHFNTVHPPTSWFSQWSLSFWISHQYPICIPLLHSFYMPCSSHPPWLDHSNYAWRRVQVMNVPFWHKEKLCREKPFCERVQYRLNTEVLRYTDKIRCLFVHINSRSTSSESNGRPDIQEILGLLSNCMFVRTCCYALSWERWMTQVHTHTLLSKSYLILFTISMSRSLKWPSSFRIPNTILRAFITTPVESA